MRYMMMTMGDAAYENDEVASDELQAKMGEFIGKLAAEGVFVDGAGLMPSRHGFRASLKDGKVAFTDGPFTEAKEIVGGYAIVDVTTEEQARKITRDFINLHVEAGATAGDCVIRRLEDIPESA